MKLLHNYVLVECVEKESGISSSGLIISNNDRIGYGTVVAVGRGRLMEDGTYAPIDGINVGDSIMYKKGGDELVTIENKSYILIGDIAVIMVG